MYGLQIIKVIHAGQPIFLKSIEQPHGIIDTDRPIEFHIMNRNQIGRAIDQLHKLLCSNTGSIGKICCFDLKKKLL